MLQWLSVHMYIGQITTSFDCCPSFIYVYIVYNTTLSLWPLPPPSGLNKFLFIFSVWSYPCYCTSYWVLQAWKLWSGESGNNHGVFPQNDNVAVTLRSFSIPFSICIFYYWEFFLNDICISSLLAYRNRCSPLWGIHLMIRATSVSQYCFCFVLSVHTL